MLRGQEAVRADRRLGTDEKHIRAQSAISCKARALSPSLPITVFSARMAFIRAGNTVGARSAQWSHGAYNGIGNAEYLPYIIPSSRGSQRDICGI